MPDELQNTETEKYGISSNGRPASIVGQSNNSTLIIPDIGQFPLNTQPQVTSNSSASYDSLKGGSVRRPRASFSPEAPKESLLDDVSQTVNLIGKVNGASFGLAVPLIDSGITKVTGLDLGSQSGVLATGLGVTSGVLAAAGTITSIVDGNFKGLGLQVGKQAGKNALNSFFSGTSVPTPDTTIFQDFGKGDILSGVTRLAALPVQGLGVGLNWIGGQLGGQVGQLVSVAGQGVTSVGNTIAGIGRFVGDKIAAGAAYLGQFAGLGSTTTQALTGGGTPALTGSGSWASGLASAGASAAGGILGNMTADALGTSKMHTADGALATEIAVDVVTVVVGYFTGGDPISMFLTQYVGRIVDPVIHKLFGVFQPPTQGSINRQIFETVVDKTETFSKLQLQFGDLERTKSYKLDDPIVKEAVDKLGPERMNIIQGFSRSAAQFLYGEKNEKDTSKWYAQENAIAAMMAKNLSKGDMSTKELEQTLLTGLFEIASASKRQYFKSLAETSDAMNSLTKRYGKIDINQNFFSDSEKVTAALAKLSPDKRELLNQFATSVAGEFFDETNGKIPGRYSQGEQVRNMLAVAAANSNFSYDELKNILVQGLRDMKEERVALEAEAERKRAEKEAKDRAKKATEQPTPQPA